MTPKKKSLIMENINLKNEVPRAQRKLEIKIEIFKKINEIKDLNRELIEMDSYKTDNRELVGLPILEQLIDELLINKI